MGLTFHRTLFVPKKMPVWSKQSGYLGWFETISRTLYQFTHGTSWVFGVSEQSTLYPIKKI